MFKQGQGVEGGADVLCPYEEEGRFKSRSSSTQTGSVVDESLDMNFA